KDIGPLTTHASRIRRHDLEIGSDIRSEIHLVDDEEIRAGDSRPTLARDLLALAHADDVKRQIGELGRESRRHIVPARFYEDHIEIGMPAIELGDRPE